MTGPVFHLQLLGTWQLTADGSPVRLRSREQRVVALLALRDFSSRTEVATTLWPESTRRQAQGSLRAAVFNLRREAPGVVVTDPDTVALNEKTRTDVRELIRQAERACAARIDTTEEAIAGLDAPELLTGWYEEWVDEERDALRTLRLEGLIRVAQNCLEHHRAEVAQAAAAAALVVDPLHEPGCELLVRAHLALGEKVDAIREFERFRKRLGAEVGMEPSGRLHSLAYGDAAGAGEPRRLRAVRSPVRNRRPVNPLRGVERTASRD